MSAGPTFEQYLASKKIDSVRFRAAEPNLWAAWEREFAQMHPNSFTVQKLNLINPIRRKYQMAPASEEKKPGDVGATVVAKPATTTPAAVKPGKPIIRPKLK